MAKKEALRELQTRLAERLQSARSQGQSAAWLAVETGGVGFLLPLSQAGEIFPPAALLPVPHTQPWFMGVANLRGRLHGVIDLAAFLGLPVASRNESGREPARLVALNPSLESYCALWVDRLAGLRSREQLQLADTAQGHQPAFAGGRWVDAQGRQWQELQLAALASHEAFLKIGQ